MPNFESEFISLMSALWALNKATFNPYARREIGKAVTRGVPRFDFQRPQAASEAATNLKERGFHNLGVCLSADDLAQVRSCLEKLPVSNNEERNYQSQLVPKTRFALAQRPADVFLAGYDSADLLRCAPLVRLASDPLILAAVESHIGCTPTISAFLVWHTFPGHADVDAEVFHRDRACFSFVKLFVYLSDVGAEAGPHEFIQGSHNADTLKAYFQSRGLQVDLQRLFEGNARHLQHGDLQAILGPNVVTTTGPAGFGFLEDTFGLHRGTRPRSASRLIFSVTYTGLPLPYANENDRAEMGGRIPFAEAGLQQPSDVQRYLLRYYLT